MDDYTERKSDMKRLFLYLLAACLLLTLFAPAALAAEAEATDETEETRPADSCGEDLTWKLEGNTLTISGTGAMDDFSSGAPWQEQKDSIHTLVLSGGVTTVGAGAFAGCSELTAIDFGSALREIGAEAFKGCGRLASISLPATFRRFGASSFEGCTNLGEVYCSGGMPSFNANCLWNGNTITVYCPVNNIWPAQYVEELETNFYGRLEVLCADGTDPYVFDAETEPTAAPTTEPAAPTTEPETEPTVPPTTQPAATETAAEPTAESTLPTEELPEPTREPEDSGREFPLMGILIGVLVVSGTLSLLLIGLLIYKSKQGGKYAD